MTLPPRPRPTVVIVGAGIAGLMMGILLDKMDIPYTILERAPKVKPLGIVLFYFFPFTVLTLSCYMSIFALSNNISFYSSRCVDEFQWKHPGAV